MGKFIKNMKLYYYLDKEKEERLAEILFVVYTILISIALYFMLFTDVNEFLISFVLLFLVMSMIFTLTDIAKDF